MKPITVYVSEEQLRRLRALHEHTKVPKSVILRDGLDSALEFWERKFGLDEDTDAEGAELEPETAS